MECRSSQKWNTLAVQIIAEGLNRVTLAQLWVETLNRGALSHDRWPTRSHENEHAETQAGPIVYHHKVATMIFHSLSVVGLKKTGTKHLSVWLDYWEYVQYRRHLTLSILLHSADPVEASINRWQRFQSPGIYRSRDVSCMLFEDPLNFAECVTTDVLRCMHCGHAAQSESLSSNLCNF
jgi:hypothetical protein